MREIKIRCWKQAKGATDNGMIPADKLFFEEQALLSSLLRDSDTHKYMLYTGLKDRNGIDIYEEDIVQSQRYTGVIQYLNGSYYINTVHYRFFLPLDSSTSQDVKVIGNTYETPELLIQQ